MDCFPNLRSVVFFTDSKVAEAHAGEYKQPKSASVEAFPLVRLGVAFDNILKDLARAKIVVEVRHVEGVRNQLANMLSRVAESGGFKEVVFRQKGKVVECKFISVMADRVHLPSASFLDMPTVAGFYRKYLIFRAWAHLPVERDDLVMLRILQQAQRLDAKVNHRILELKAGRGRTTFELHNGLLVYCPPVFETFSRQNLAREIREVVLPASMIK